MFIGRKKELRLLHDIINADKPAIGVIYGRRRIGKSELIKKAFEDKKVLVFEGLENRPRQEQIENFLFQLYYQTRNEFIKKKVKTWQEAFLLLYEELQTNPAHVVFDEFQWMANYRREVVSALKPAWDLYLSKISGITLILCGSIASFMMAGVIKSGALYGRTDLVIRLKGFLLSDTKSMLEGKGIHEITEAQMLFGGIPKYLDLVREKPSIRIGMEELGFTETGYLTDEYDRIFISHFGKNPEYEKIVKTLARHSYGLFRKQISEKTGIALGGGLTTYLTNLESAGFISSSAPFNKEHNSRIIKYFLCDSYLQFYFEFIFPNLKKIKSGVHTSLFGQIAQSGKYNSWIGRAFENLCIDHAGRISEILGFSGIEFSFGPYFTSGNKKQRGTQPGGQGVQIDLLFDRKDNVITLCEMKYTTNRVGTGIIDEVMKKVDILQEKFRNKTIQKVLISKNDATKDLASSGFFYRIIKSEELF